MKFVKESIKGCKDVTLFIIKKILGRLIGRDMPDFLRKKCLKQVWIGDQEMYALNMRKGEETAGANEEVYLAKKPVQLEQGLSND